MASSPAINSPATFEMSATSPNIIIDLYSQNLDDVGDHSITLTSTLKDYNPFAGATAPTTSDTFKLTAFNPCLSTAITAEPDQIENFVSFAGYSTQSLVKYAFNDTISYTKTLDTDAADFCGSKSISISLNNTNSDWLSLDSQKYIAFSPPKDTT